jgi:hypothetical protein
VEIPDYFLARPPGGETADASAFERLYAEQVAPGGGGSVDYRLEAPRWQFLCWLAETKDIVLHGSGSPHIAEFEPRTPADMSEFGGRRAVFAASDGIWAMFFAIADRGVATSLVNMSVVVEVEGATPSYYYFSINDDALAGGAWRPGTVYILPRRGFVRQEDDYSYGVRIRSNQWASPEAIRPLASLAVTPDDFPFLGQVNGHDQATVARRAAQDPQAFPWRD